MHRVVAQRSVFPSNRELEITPDYLERLIEEYRQKGFSFVAIDEMVGDLHRRPWDLRRKKRVNISFDDGFRDVYDYAFPILKRHHIPFTIYVVGSFPDGDADLWWIQLERLMGEDVAGFENTLRACYQSEKNMREVMHEMTASEPDPRLCAELALSWQQLEEMVASGLCTVGSHSMTHPGLNRIDHDAMLWELTESKKHIEAHLPVEVHHFSYPHSMENEAVQTALRQAGYLTATLGYGGTVRKANNPYKLYRRYIVQP